MITDFSDKTSPSALFWEYFRERGIRRETVEACGARLSEPSETALAVGDYLFAICWEYGNGYRRYRFLGDPALFPRDEDGDPIKAKALRGAGNRLFIPRRPGQTAGELEAQKRDPAVPVVVVEGEADCLGVLQADSESLVVGIAGCWSWKSSKQPLLPELRALALPGRLFVLAPDSDWSVNVQVYRGWSRLGGVLAQLGCRVQVVLVPSNRGRKQGAGDYLIGGRWSDLPRVELSEWRRERKKEEKRSRRGGVTDLVELAMREGTYFHDPTGAGWVDFVYAGHRYTARVKSNQFRDFLARAFWDATGKAFSGEAWSQALSVLEGKARWEAPVREVWRRVGRQGDKIYIDLTPDVVEVGPEGWRVLPYADCPVAFNRSDCQLPLPVPQPGGSLEDLWRLLNVKEPDRPLVLGWLLSCLVPDGAKPILVLTGEKGAGKSSAAALLKRLVDPTKAPKLTSVGSPRQMATAALGRWVLVFDNLSHLSAEQQDLLCCVSTGAGFSHRALYTDLEEIFLEYRRPQILTGVDLVPTRSDLLDRSLLVRLDRIPDERRMPEAALEQLMADLLPGIYGALLDLLVTGIRNLPTTKPAKLPRMADFALLCIAAGIPHFVQAYTRNVQEGSQAAVEADPVAALLQQLVEQEGSWEGTATELVARLQELDPTSRDLQRLSSRSLGRRLAGSLRGDLQAVGIRVEQVRDPKQRRIRLAFEVCSDFEVDSSDSSPKKTSLTSLTSEPLPDKDPDDDVFEAPPPKTSSPAPQNVITPPPLPPPPQTSQTSGAPTRTEDWDPLFRRQCESLGLGREEMEKILTRVTGAVRQWRGPLSRPQYLQALRLARELSSKADRG